MKLVHSQAKHVVEKYGDEPFIRFVPLANSKEIKRNISISVIDSFCADEYEQNTKECDELAFHRAVEYVKYNFFDDACLLLTEQDIARLTEIISRSDQATQSAFLEWAKRLES